ncbi:hypothetical protein BH24ACT19_BH24ACT19_13040 [soil metagenome]
MKRGALSSFIEEAVGEKLFRQTVEEVKERNDGYTPEGVEADVVEAVSEARRAGGSRH